MKLSNEINKIREQYSEDTSLTHYFKQLNYSYFYNYTQKDILVFGLNPTKYKVTATSKIKSYQFEDLLTCVTEESYLYYDILKRIEKVLNSKSNGIKLLQGTAFTNLFYHQTNSPIKDLDFLIQNNVSFLNQQIKLTYRLLNDVIQPKIIILTHEELLSFFDKKNKLFKDVETFNYGLNFIKKTKSGHKIYELKSSNKQNITDTLQNVRIIVTPYLYSGNLEENEIDLKAEEILEELFTVARIKNLEPKYEYIDLDGSLWINTPSLYNLVKTVRIKAVDESLILNLKIWRNLNIYDFIKQVVDDLHQKNLLNIQDYQNLISPIYSEKEFNSKIPILKKRTDTIKPSMQTIQNLIVNNKVLEKHNTKEQVQKWYIHKILKKTND